MNRSFGGRQLTIPGHNWGPGAAIGLFGIAGVLLVLFSTMYGVGISPDSVGYIGAARSLLAGRGLTSPAVVTEQPNTLALQPPFFPLVLSAFGLLGVEPAVGARWLNALLMGANAMLVGTMIYRNTQGAGLAALLGMTLMLTSTDMLSVHTMAWTEPLFVFLSMATISLLASRLGTDQGSFAAAGTTASLAFLTRYPGAALVLTGIVAIVSPRTRPLRKRLRSAFLFSAVAFLPLTLWMFRNLLTVGSVAGRDTVLRPITVNHLMSLLTTYTNWLVPSDLPGVPLGVSRMMSFAALSGMVLFSILLVRRGVRYQSQSPSRDSGTLPQLLFIFAALYTALLLSSATLLADFWFASLGGRHQTPVFAAALVALVCLGHRAVRLGSPAFRIFVTSVCVILVASYATRATVWVTRQHNDGQGYASRSWRESLVIGEVNSLPPDVPVFSNAPDAIYFLTGRPTRALPAKFVLTKGRANTDYPVELARLAEFFETRDAALVYFRTVTWRWYLPAEAELVRSLPVQAVFKTDEGTVYLSRR